MQIGIEAKRIFENTTGLGNASRSICTAIATCYPQHTLHLYTPQLSNNYSPLPNSVVHTSNKNTKLGKIIWRSLGINALAKKHKLHTFFGIGAELPLGIHQHIANCVVLIHDIIFEIYPKLYNPIDVITYRKKIKYACNIANKIAVVSEQTKQDLITKYQIPANKITVTYLCVPAVFEQPIINFTALDSLNLPKQYLLYVGSIIERKGLLNIIEAMATLQHKIPLVVLGNGDKKYIVLVKNTIKKLQLENYVIFANETYATSISTLNSNIPLLYKKATALLYPSIYEGFGMPIIEAMYMGTPVITSNISCMPDIAGNAALLINPYSISSIATAIEAIINNTALRANYSALGLLNCQRFSAKNIAKNYMALIED